MATTAAVLERIREERAAPAGGARRPAWTDGLPWAGIVPVAAAAALWVAVVAGIASPLGGWLAAVDRPAPARAAPALARGVPPAPGVHDVGACGVR